MLLLPPSDFLHTVCSQHRWLYSYVGHKCFCPHPEIFFDIGRPVTRTYSPNVVGEIFIPKCIFEATHLLSSPWQCIPLMFFAMELKERNKGRRSMIVFPQNFLKSVNLMDRLGISPIYKFWPFLSQQESPSVLWTNEFWECPEHCVLIVTLRDTSMRLYENQKTS